MFQFPGFASVTYVFSAGYSRSCGFPHSDIHGSKPVRGSPWLFAAYHVLHRLSAPRHPPNALKSLDRSHFSMPRDPDDTPWNEERPNSRWPAFAGFWDHRHWKDQLQGFASPPVPPDDGAGKACGQARLAMSRTTCKNARPPCHGTESQIPSSQCQRSNHQPRSDRQILSRPGVVQPQAPIVPKTNGNMLPALESFAVRTAPGGARRDRTDDLLLAKQALSQLSYGPVTGTVVRCLRTSDP
jgi:hypothetical protein